MARRTRSRTTGLDVLARRMDRLGDDMFDEIQKELDWIADESIREMEAPWSAAIEGGPVEFTKIRPGSFKSSVIRAKSNTAVQKGLPTATIAVNKRQSAYLKYHLDGQKTGREKIRQPGDAGVAKKANFIPEDKNMRENGHQGTTKEGNIHRTTLKSLFSRAQTLKTRNAAQRERDRKRLANLLAQDPTEQELDEFRIAKKRRRVKRKAGSRSDVFFGVPRGLAKGRRKRVLGFWQRPVKPEGKLTLLVAAVPKSVYGKNVKMQTAWNAGVSIGTKAADRRLKAAVDRAAAKAAAGKR